MPKLPWTSAILLAVCFSTASTAQADIQLSFSPSTQTVTSGQPATVDVVISFGILSHPLIGSFDVLIGFDYTLIDVSTVTFGPTLGSIPSEALSSTAFPDRDHADIAEVSFLSTSGLMALQSGLDHFTLATLQFNTSGEGLSPLVFEQVTLGDDLGNPLQYQGNAGSITVASAPVPEPGALVLLASALAAIGVAGWQRRRQL